MTKTLTSFQNSAWNYLTAESRWLRHLWFGGINWHNQGNAGIQRKIVFFQDQCVTDFSKRYPYIMGIEGSQGDLCLGALITRCSIVTAASCLDPDVHNPRVVFNPWRGNGSATSTQDGQGETILTPSRCAINSGCFREFIHLFIQLLSFISWKCIQFCLVSLTPIVLWCAWYSADLRVTSLLLCH